MRAQNQTEPVHRSQIVSGDLSACRVVDDVRQAYRSVSMHLGNGRSHYRESRLPDTAEMFEFATRCERKLPPSHLRTPKSRNLRRQQSLQQLARVNAELLRHGRAYRCQSSAACPIRCCSTTAGGGEGARGEAQQNAQQSGGGQRWAGHDLGHIDQSKKPGEPGFCRSSLARRRWRDRGMGRTGLEPVTSSL